ncbi:hypothetical protein OKW43_002064 [Paraburkholderia sp. WC7.3g]
MLHATVKAIRFSMRREPARFLARRGLIRF